MAIYLYSPGNRSDLQAKTIGLLGNEQDIETERLALLDAGREAVSRGEAHTQEIEGQLAKANPKRLPVELMGRLLNPDYYDTPIMSTAGLAIYAPNTEGSPNFDLLSEEVENVEDLVAEGRMDRDSFANLPVRSAITHDALLYEPYESDNGRLKVRTHEAFGYYVRELFFPIVVVLSSEHPVRQLIEQAHQG